MMKWTVVLGVLIITVASFTTQNNQAAFGSGKYQVHFTGKELGDYEIEVIRDKYIKHLPHLKIEGTISQIDDNLYYFHDKVDSTVEIKDAFLKEIKRSFEAECLEMKKVSKNKIAFRTTYEGNLHLTLNKGVFIKKKGK